LETSVVKSRPRCALDVSLTEGDEKLRRTPPLRNGVLEFVDGAGVGCW
jgi:hypothetical protein